MSRKQKLLSDVRKKRLYLENRLKETNDSVEQKTIAFSLASYLQMEYSLSKLNFYVDKLGKTILKRDFIFEKSIPYLKILGKGFECYLEELDLDYVNSLTEILSERFFTSIPVTVDVTNRKLIEISEQFYNECFDGEIREKGIDLLKEDNIFFTDYDFCYSNAVGKNYTDLYFGDNYSFINRQNNDMDLISIPHEIFHGVNAKINPSSLIDSIPETEEIGTYGIELILFDFLDKLYGSVGTGLKKLFFFNIGFEASKLKENIFNSVHISSYVTDFLDLEARVVSYGIYQLYKVDKNKGEEKLVEFAKHNFQRDRLPDYSCLGFSKEVICSLAQMMVEERQVFISQQKEELKEILNSVQK